MTRQGISSSCSTKRSLNLAWQKAICAKKSRIPRAELGNIVGMANRIQLRLQQVEMKYSFQRVIARLCPLPIPLVVLVLLDPLRVLPSAVFPSG
mmetsp:Transcript_11543/g.22706  ORF Transcript_11543/g.22706 Transcript_11543/m.22706 type:complete len:94 (+) Transcript_11543:2798-3079(+)